MRTISVRGRDFQIRSLKRKERKALEQKGHRLPVPIYQDAFKTMDAVFEIIFDEETMAFIDDELDDAEAGEIWQAFQAETFGAPDEIKNL